MGLNLEDAARLIGTSREMLERWARQGAVPAWETTSGYQFDQRALQKWAEQRGMQIRPSAAVQPPLQPSAPALNLYDVIKRGGVLYDITGSSAEEVLCAAVAQISLPDEQLRNLLLSQLLEREKLASTGIGGGIAIPHPRQPITSLATEGVIYACFLRHPVGFDAVDGQPVFVLFIMLSPSTKIHLQLLSRLSFCLHENAFVQFLADTPTADELFERIRQKELCFRKNPT